MLLLGTKKLYYVRLNLTKYGFSPIFTRKIPFMNIGHFYLNPPLPPSSPGPKVTGKPELRDRCLSCFPAHY